MSNNQYFSLEQYKNQKELEEGRKAGKIKAKIDVDGKEINPHMPQFITEAPWYLNQQSTSMKHQYFSQKSKPETEEFYARGQKGFQATKYRKGACTNCGALTHQQKDCCQRPRMKGAAITNKDIAADDIIKDIQFTYDSKHFNWNGYNPEDYMETVKEKERIEELRKQLKEDEGEVGESNKQTTKYDDGTRQLDENVGEQIKGNNKQLSQNSFWTTTSQRIREDIAKYLINYNSDSVYYNPKCRSMRENPTPNDPNAVFEGENELRNTGGAAQFLKQEIFAWHSAQQNGQDLNCISNPTLTEKVFKQMQQYQSTIKAKYLQKILKDYGEDNHLNEDLNLILRQTEKYVEFTVDGSLQQSQKLYQSRQKYLEDQYFNNHTTIWGSFFSNFFGWGYGCCHSNVKNSMCLGERGKQESEKREILESKKRDEELKEAKNIAVQEEQQRKKDLNSKKLQKGEKKSIQKQIKLLDSFQSTIQNDQIFVRETNPIKEIQNTEHPNQRKPIQFICQQEDEDIKINENQQNDHIQITQPQR